MSARDSQTRDDWLVLRSLPSLWALARGWLIPFKRSLGTGHGGEGVLNLELPYIAVSNRGNM